MSSAGQLVPTPIHRLAGRPRTAAPTPAPTSIASADAASTAIYEATKWTGGSVAAALELVREWWDEAEDGPLPDKRTALRWAERDGWTLRVMQEIADDRKLFDATINLAMKRNLLLALHTQGKILRGEGDPDFATAQRGVARDLMFLCGAGILGVRYGDVDTDAALEGTSERPSLQEARGQRVARWSAANVGRFGAVP